MFWHQVTRFDEISDLAKSDQEVGKSDAAMKTHIIKMMITSLIAMFKHLNKLSNVVWKNLFGLIDFRISNFKKWPLRFAAVERPPDYAFRKIKDCILITLLFRLEDHWKTNLTSFYLQINCKLLLSKVHFTSSHT